MIPKREQILQKAKELFFNDMAKSGINNFNDPEPNELAESGYCALAQSMLMRSEDSEYKTHIEEEANRLGLIKERIEGLETKELADVLDLNEVMKSGVYVSGTSGHGKSDLMMYLSDLLMQKDVIVIVIDSSQDWLLRSSIPNVQRITNAWIGTIPEQSLIMDISLLSIPQRQNLAENFCMVLYEKQVKTPKHLRKQFFIIFEESHVYLTEAILRSKKFQNVTRLLTEGRNYNVRFGCVTQFAGLISKTAMKFMRMRFFGYADEPNDLKFISGFLGSEHVKQLRDLEHGSFIAYASGKLSLVHVEPYQSEIIKTEVKPIIPEIEHVPQPNNMQAIVSLGSFAVWLLALLIVLSQGRGF